MPPLITREEALRLGEIEDHAEIEALIERAWKALRQNPDGRQGVLQIWDPVEDFPHPDGSPPSPDITPCKRPWSAKACRVFSGIVLIVSGAASAST